MARRPAGARAHARTRPRAGSGGPPPCRPGGYGACPLGGRLAAPLLPALPAPHVSTPGAGRGGGGRGQVSPVLRARHGWPPVSKIDVRPLQGHDLCHAGAQRPRRARPGGGSAGPVARHDDVQDRLEQLDRGVGGAGLEMPECRLELLEVLGRDPVPTPRTRLGTRWRLALLSFCDRSASRQCRDDAS